VVDYVSIAADADYHAFIKSLASANLRGLSHNESFAVGINAYNAFAIKTLIDHACKYDSAGTCTGPAYGLPDISVRGTGGFDLEEHTLGGKKYSLNDIEGLMRPQPMAPLFQAPFPKEDLRIHATLVCDGTSCPNLATSAYTPDQVDQQMTAVSVWHLGSGCQCGAAVVLPRVDGRWAPAACLTPLHTHTHTHTRTHTHSLTHSLTHTHTRARARTHFADAVVVRCPRPGQATTSWMANPWKGMRINTTNNTLWVSKIFSWFADEVNAQGGFVNVYTPYMTKKAQAYFAAHKPSDYDTQILGYIWDANGPVPCNCMPDVTDPSVLPAACHIK